MTVIYFMQPVDGGPVKIGHSDDVPRRQRELQTTYRRRLAILATQDGNAEREREIHQRFAHLRIGCTEQFRPDAELLEFIGQRALVTMNPEMVEAMPSRSTTFLIRVREEWKDWLSRFAFHCRRDKAEIVDDALEAYAQAKGFEPPPKR